MLLQQAVQPQTHSAGFELGIALPQLIFFFDEKKIFSESSLNLAQIGLNSSETLPAYYKEF